MSSLEWIAVALGLANIALLIRRSLWNYPFGLAMVACYFVIFRDAKLYSDMWLQVFFFIVQIIGWVAWLRARGGSDEVPTRTLSSLARIGWIAAIGVAIVAWGTMILRIYPDAAFPYWDASVAMGSVAAQILLAQRYVENWIGWIGVNLLSIGLYWTKGLLPTAGLYSLFLVLAVVGLIQWRKTAPGAKAAADASPHAPQAHSGATVRVD